MRPVSLLSIVVLPILAACGPSQEAFIEDVVIADCEYLLECEDPAILSFQGWDTPEACQADRGPEVAADALGCEYDRKAGKACIEAVEEQSCAAEGEDRVYPAICNDVFINCTGTDTDTESDTESDTEPEAASL